MAHCLDKLTKNIALQLTMQKGVVMIIMIGKFAIALVNDISQSYVLLEETVKTLHLKVHYLSMMGLMIC